MRQGSTASPELIANIKSRLADGLVTAARENPDFLALAQRLIEDSFHGAEKENALAWLLDQTDSRENVKLLIRFPGNPSAEVDKELASLGFEWSNFAKGWMGEGNPLLLREKFAPHKAVLRRC